MLDNKYVLRLLNLFFVMVLVITLEKQRLNTYELPFYNKVLSYLHNKGNSYIFKQFLLKQISCIPGKFNWNLEKKLALPL